MLNVINDALFSVTALKYQINGMTDLTFANDGRKTVFQVTFASIFKPNVQLQSPYSLIFHVLKAIEAISEYNIVTSNPHCP